MSRLFPKLLLLGLLCACAPDRKSPAPLDDSWPEIPSSLTDSAVAEQFIVDFLYRMGQVDSVTASQAYRVMLRHIPSERQEFIIDKSSDYLYSIDSPLYSTSLYPVVIDALIAEDAVDDDMAEILRLRHADLMKNRVGSTATDFRILTRQGRMTTLSELAKEETGDRPCERIILLFYDPDCNVCAETEARMAADPQLNAQIQAGRVKVIAVDPGDTPQDRWQQHAQTLPDSWTVGRSPNGEIDRLDLYILRTTPTVYHLTPSLLILSETH